MNSISKLGDVQWYIKAIKEVIVNGRVLPKNRNKYYIRDEKEISAYLINLGISLNDFSHVYSNSVFENFIVAEYKDLKEFYIKIKSIQTQADNTKYNINDKIPQKLLKTYNKFSYKNLNNLIIKKMNVKVCPYCNENYIINRGKKYASAQLDHFFDKSSNPLFAICLYNLIPSCGTCNHIKSNRELLISPFDEQIDREKLKISYKPLSSNYIKKNDNIEIVFKTTGADGKNIKRDIETLKIPESYKFHRDYVQEILKKRIIYSRSQIKELYKSYGNLFKDEEELVRIIFGNYINSKDLNKRPLSKLTKDILKEIL